MQVREAETFSYMRYFRRPRFMVLVALLYAVDLAHTCTLANGYFYQVTRLRGAIVGTATGWRGWLRHRVPVASTKIRLYKYCHPCHVTDQPPIRVVETDEEGRFDFGPLKVGHYTLVVDWPTNADSFDVEITQLPTTTALVKIDVSPIRPDCTGGHEFTVVPEQN